MVTKQRNATQSAYLRSLVHLLTTQTKQLADWLQSNDATAQAELITDLKKLIKRLRYVNREVNLDSPNNIKAAILELGFLTVVVNETLPSGLIYGNPQRPEEEAANLKASEIIQQHAVIVRLLKTIYGAPS